MTVEEVIAQLMQIEDKSKQVCIATYSGDKVNYVMEDMVNVVLA